MSSGRRTMVINTQERAVSTDINRLQAFAARDEAELLRYLLAGTSFGETGQAVVYPNGGELGASAEVMGGLLVRPTTGTFEIQVDPGVIFIHAIDGDADASIYKYVRDAGVGPGILTIGANASGSIRIDVIECRLNPVPLIVSDNRDVFDTNTGLFSAISQTKETTGRLEWRVRQGTPGGGYPTAVAGWVPMCIASVPSGAVSNDSITFWDVRPLMEDRVRLRKGVFKPELYELDGKLQRVGAADVRLTGFFRAQVKGRALGGQFRRSSPGAENNYLNVAELANQASAIAEGLTGHVYLYACTPHGLPRWAMYDPAPAARVPRGTQGILIASYVAPDVFGNPQSTIALPSATGLGGQVQIDEAVCVMVVPRMNTNQFGQGHVTNKTFLGHQPIDPSIAGSVSGGNLLTYSIPESYWPQNAKAAWLRFDFGGSMPATTSALISGTVYSFEDNTNTSVRSSQPMDSICLSNPSGSPQAYTHLTSLLRVPLPNRYPSSQNTPRRLDLQLAITNYGTGSVTVTFGTLAAFGFEF